MLKERVRSDQREWTVCHSLSIRDSSGSGVCDVNLVTVCAQNHTVYPLIILLRKTRGINDTLVTRALFTHKLSYIFKYHVMHLVETMFIYSPKRL